MTKYTEIERSEVDNFIAGKRTADERYRSVLRTARWFKGITAGQTVTILILVLFIRDLASKSQLVPYVMQLDLSGRIVNTEILKERRAGDPPPLPQETIIYELTDFVERWRTVTTDKRAQKNFSDRVFNHVKEHSDADRFILSWYRAHDPRTEDGKTVEPHIRNIVAQSEHTYELYWRESEVTNNNGQAPAVSNWRATATLEYVPRTLADVAANQSGMFVTRITEPQKDAL